MSNETLLREPTVIARLGIGRTTWRQWIANGTYGASKPIKVAPKIVAWKKSDIDAIVARILEAGA